MDVSAGATRRVARAAELWRSSLINVSGSNRLLYFKDLRVGTLDLSDAPQGAVSELLAMKTTRLSRLFPAGDEVTGAVKSLKTVSTKARVFAEEYGIHVTNVASGFATWPVSVPGPGSAWAGPDGGATPRLGASAPRAPVLLRPVDVTPRAGSVDGFELTVTAEPQVNPVLLHVLQAHGVRVDEVALLERSDDDEAAFDVLRKLCREALPGFHITPGLVLANLFYAEQPLVEDLGEDRAEFLASSTLVAALAGDESATQAVRTAGGDVAVDAPDRRPPGDEYLVLDADGSQSYVVNAVAAGQNLVVQGPPGTGKSQTIANVIADLVARDKRVLFVAQKRAAITAVLRRLEQVRLEHLVLDLFDAGGSRRAVVQGVSRAIDQRRTVARPRVDALHHRLSESRQQLVDSRQALHELRAPWGVAFAAEQAADGTRSQGLYDLALSTSSYRSALRLPVDDLLRWSEDTYDRARTTLAAFVVTGGTQPWLVQPGWSVAALRTSEDVAAGEQALEAVARRLPTALDQSARLAGQLCLPVPTTQAEVRQLLDVARTVDEVTAAGAARALDPTTTSDELAEQVAVTGPKAERTSQVAQLGFMARRRLLKATKERYPSVDEQALPALLQRAQDLRATWPNVFVRQTTGALLETDRAEQAWASLGQAVEALLPYVQKAPLEDMGLSELEQVVAQLSGDRRHRRLPRLHDLRQDLVDMGCLPVLQDFLRQQPLDETEAEDRFTQAFAMSLIEHLERTDPRLAALDGEALDRATAQFAQGDVEARQANADRVRRAAAERLAAVLDAEPAQSEVVRDQARRKRGFKPVRQLLDEAPDVLLAAKPVWAASPQAVSEFLPTRRLFDVVIFDEASQVQQAAALPAIARAAQTVVAGDSLQLPPTTLFTRTVESSEADRDELEDQDDPSSGLVIKDMESILDAVETKLGPQRSRHLSWHYRSRDERLIATSNRWVYEPVGRGMTTFPAADGLRALEHVVVPASPGVGPNNKSPRDEVRKVVDLCIEHAHRSPGDSLGVIAFGTEHANRIEAELERRLVDEPEQTRAWFAPVGDEPFFVKNIERVQGDEREKVILTVGYARGASGDLSYNWGPVLQAGGHRRVNVAISRARSDIVLVTSFAATEVDERRSDAEGFQLMRRFITFASTAGEDFGDVGAQPVQLNPFEADIMRRLTEAELDVTPQYGVGNYRLDFAVRHPLDSGRFVLAVEADGAAYHSGVVARERDRLRQQALEARGWTFARIWSTDYFHDPEKQIDRVLTAYREALKRAASPATRVQETQVQEAVVQEASAAAEARGRGPRPPVPRGLPILQYSDQQLDAMVAWVRSDDMAHTRDELFEMVMLELGFKKRGSNIVARIRAAIERSTDA